MGIGVAFECRSRRSPGVVLSCPVVAEYRVHIVGSEKPLHAVIGADDIVLIRHIATAQEACEDVVVDGTVQINLIRQIVHSLFTVSGKTGIDQVVQAILRPLEVLFIRNVLIGEVALIHHAVCLELCSCSMVVCAEHCLRERRFFPGLRVN